MYKLGRINSRSQNFEESGVFLMGGVQSSHEKESQAVCSLTVGITDVHKACNLIDSTNSAKAKDSVGESENNKSRELVQFVHMVEEAHAQKALLTDIHFDEYHTWANHIGGNLNTRSRMHKPHHTVKTTPYLGKSFIMPHIEQITNEPFSAIDASLMIKRRNSTGSIKVHLTVDDMDADGMIRVISLILHRHIVNGSSLNWKIDAQYLIFDDSVMRFRGSLNEEVPTSVQVHDFFSYVHRTAQLECDCVVSSLFYIERLLTETAGKLRMCPRNWRSIILSGMILASKVWDDLSMWSVDFARVGHVTLQRINQLEVAVLESLQYNVRIDSSSFARYFFQLRHWCLILEAATVALNDRHEKMLAENAIKRNASMTRAYRTKSLPCRLMSPSMDIQRTRTLSSSQFASIYKGLFPCMEELVKGQLTSAGGCRECCNSLKEHELQSHMSYYLRKITDKTDGKKSVRIILGELRDVYDTEPKRILGVGVSGVVQIVRHRETGIEYALKTLQIDRLKDFRKKGELRNEIEVLSRLNHPNIVRLLEIYESPMRDSVSLIMELCTGGELLGRLNASGRYSEERCTSVTRKMLCAVQHCHENNICHRDLKLENWVFKDNSPDAELKLIDFGLSRHFEDNEVMTVPVGTPYTIAPEVLNSSYTNACDLWSVGVQVYILLTGVIPFSGDDDFKVLQAVKKGHWSWPPYIHISNDAKDFVEKLIITDASKRLTAAQALKHPWVDQPKNGKILIASHLKVSVSHIHAREYRGNTLCYQ